MHRKFLTNCKVLNNGNVVTTHILISLSWGNRGRYNFHQLEHERTPHTLPAALRVPDPLAPLPLHSPGTAGAFPESDSHHLPYELPEGRGYLSSFLYCSARHGACHPVGAPIPFLPQTFSEHLLCALCWTVRLEKQTCSLPCSFQAEETEVNEQERNQC